MCVCACMHACVLAYVCMCVSVCMRVFAGLIPQVDYHGIKDCSQIVCADFSKCQVTQTGIICECEKNYKAKGGRCYKLKSMLLCFVLIVIFV